MARGKGKGKQQEAPHFDPFRIEYLPYPARITPKQGELAQQVGQTIVREVVRNLLTRPAHVHHGMLARHDDPSVIDNRPFSDRPSTIPTLQCRYPHPDRRRLPAREFFLLDVDSLPGARRNNRAMIARTCALRLLQLFDNSGGPELKPGRYAMFRGGLVPTSAGQFVEDITMNRRVARVPDSAEAYANQAGLFAQEMLWKVTGKPNVLPSVRVENGTYGLVYGWHLHVGDILERT